MFKVQGAVVKEQGITFAIVVVKGHILDSPNESEKAQRSFSTLFPGMPIVLMAQDGQGVPRYRGRADIANFLAHIDFKRIPWKEYTFSEK